MLQFSQKGYQPEGMSLYKCRCIQNSFWLWEPFPVVQGWLWGNESQLKMLVNLHLLQMETANNSVMHISTVIVRGGILVCLWPLNSQKKFWLCDFRCQSKSGITEFFKHLHYSIYKPSQWSTSCCEWLTTVKYNLWWCKNSIWWWALALRLPLCTIREGHLEQGVLKLLASSQS